jgi:hypothetical protein
MAKRGQNEGTIYKRKDGRWASVINLGFQGGKLTWFNFPAHKTLAKIER